MTVPGLKRRQEAACRAVPRLIEPDRDASWAAVADHPLTGLFSSAPWARAVAGTYGFTISAAVQEGADGATSALLFSHVSDLRGDRIVCGPFCDYCDPLLDDSAAWEDLVAPLMALGIPITLRCLRNTIPAQDRRFSFAGRAAWHGIHLARPEAELWQGLDGSARQNVRKAQRLGVTVREGRSLEDVRTFFDMHCHVRKTKYRLLPQPFALFEALHANFAPEDRLCVMLAECNGAVVAGILFLIWRDTLYYKFNASTDRQTCPNDLLVWEGIRFGQRRGLMRFDFGASDYVQPGLLRYKRKFATEESEILRLRWQPPGYADPRAEQAGFALSRMTQLLTEPGVPDVITRAAGEAFYAQFC
ncbi:GNAT family N-acetyltransferase (plasmid) [Rhodovastum atsumiense]|uniref:GNAT family N-acetyltransferase n=1 Tax=Rhodovastum atsumiense TaxID=504468 RepID=A0A5M6ILC7_9PROT|nr:GNAT family N-acetyltransferase [Rhodovastum atsumiense]KAA5608425.1 GNAT family N-acetyltransferase [Rhodovastum atsumiense]CAH2605707.1 GNAT family N-acetyltransferase [Rhodovastum atsumiense]